MTTSTPVRARERREPILNPGNKLANLKRAVHVLVGLALMALGVSLIFVESTARTWEAMLATTLANNTFATDTMFLFSAEQPAIGFTLGEQWHILRVTTECAIVLFLGPVAFVAGLLALSVRMNIVRILVATGVGMAGLILLNQVRLLAICYAWGNWGKEAFHWVHGPAGTILMLIGLSGVLALFFIIVLKHREPSHNTNTALSQEQPQPSE